MMPQISKTILISIETQKEEIFSVLGYGIFVFKL
jgi:hypothetical protein